MPDEAGSLHDFFTTSADRETLARFDVSAVPQHVAIIMDGNGRWAQKRGLPRIAGHRAGAQAIRESIAACIELGVRFLTIYSFSSENWRRSTDEVSGLMSLFIEVLERELDSLQEQHVRVLVIGREAGMPNATMEAFRRAERATRDNEALTLIVALNYGGRAEITDAVRSIAADVAHGTLSPAEVDESTVSERLYTVGIPDPDLIVRTSGELRISNFLLWQLAYAELYATDILWPDFKRGDLLRAVVDFQRRTRRYGGR